jgi:hypothetical protein
MNSTNEGGLAQSGNSDKAKTETHGEQTINTEFTGVPLSVCPVGCQVDHLFPGDDCWHLGAEQPLDFKLGNSRAGISKMTETTGPYFCLYVEVEAEIMPEEVEIAAQRFERLAASLRAFGAGEAVETS